MNATYMPIVALVLVAVVTGAWFWAYARHWSAALLVVFLSVGAMAGTSLTMGFPRPVLLEFVTGFQESEIAGYQLDEPNAIYIWTADNPPMSLKIPWTDKNAKRLHGNSKAEGEQRPMMLRSPRFNMGEFEIHPKPVPPNPPKVVR